VLLVIFLTSIETQAQSQDSASPDLNEMKAKLQHLEQEMQDLKGQISAVQQSQPAPGATTSTPYPAAEKSAKGREENKSSIDLYGFIMLDSGYDFKSNNPDWFDVIRPTKMPSFKGEFAPDGKVYYGVRQTRFGVKTSTPTPLGDLKTQFDLSYSGPEWTPARPPSVCDTHTVSWHNLAPVKPGAHSWTLTSSRTRLSTGDPMGWSSSATCSSAGCRFESDSLRLTFAVERPGASADGGVYSDRVELQGVKPKFDMPDFSWSARAIRGWGYMQLAGIFRKISWVDLNRGPEKDLSGDAFGGA